MHRYVLTSAILILFMLSVALMAAAPPGVPTDADPAAYKGLTQEGIAKIKTGEVLIVKDLARGESISGMIEAAVIFNQNIDKVWELIVDQVADQKRFLPYLEKSDLSAKKGNHYIVDFRLTIVGVGIDYRVDHIGEKDKYYFHWDLDPNYPNKLKTLKGFWRFYWIDETHTLARYGTWVEIGIGIPNFVQEFLIKRDLPQSLNNVKTYINSGGTWRKPGYKGN